MNLAFSLVSLVFRPELFPTIKNYRTIEIKLKLLIIYEFPQNDTPTLHTLPM